MHIGCDYLFGESHLRSDGLRKLGSSDPSTGWNMASKGSTDSLRLLGAHIFIGLVKLIKTKEQIPVNGLEKFLALRRGGHLASSYVGVHRGRDAT